MTEWEISPNYFFHCNHKCELNIIQFLLHIWVFIPEFRLVEANKENEYFSNYPHI